MATDDIDLQYFTGRVLKRDEAKTNALVIPMFAGVIARCVMTWSAHENDWEKDSEFGGLIKRCTTVVELASQAQRDIGFDMDAESYATVAKVVVDGWRELIPWCTGGHAMFLLRNSPVEAPGQIVPATLAWLAATPPASMIESVFVTTFASMRTGCKPTDCAPLSKNARKFRVLLADRLRRSQLTTWPRVLAATAAEWTPDTLAQVAMHYARGNNLLLDRMRTLGTKRVARIDRDAGIAGDPPDALDKPAPDPVADVARDANHDAAMSLVEDAAGEIAELRAERDRRRQERDHISDRHARSQSRIESLERDLAIAVAAREDLEQKLDSLVAERDSLKERLAIVSEVEIALSPGAPAPPPDALENRRVLVFTGQDAGDARDGLAERFYAFGAARVDCYWTDRDRGPDAFPGDAIIAIDTKFMGHSEWHTIEQRARAAGAWYYRGKHGVSTMAHATAAAFRVHRTRLAD